MSDPAIMIDRATRADVPAIVALLADDPIGAGREDIAAPQTYEAAFSAVEADPNSEILVARDGEAVIGCVQLTFIPGLSYRGAWRCQIEDLRVASARRSGGIGAWLMAAVEDRARERDCELVQLFVHGDRDAAHRFYDRAASRARIAALESHFDWNGRRGRKTHGL